MSFLSKIKSFFSEPEKAPEKYKVSFNQLPEHLKKLSELENKKTASIKSELQNLTNSFIKECNEAISELEGLNLQEKREHEKLKSVVAENKVLFINQLQRYISKLPELKNKNLAEYFKALFEKSAEFSKISHKSFQKSTILIGKEMEKIQSILMNYNKSVRALHDSNKILLERLEKISELQSLLEEIEKNKSLINESEGENSDIEKKIEDEEKNISINKKKIQDIKNSEAYKQDMKKKQENISLLSQLDSQLMEIKSELDIKMLNKLYHSDESKHELIQAYSKSFKTALLEDKNLEIINLAESAHNKSFNSLNEIKETLIRLSKEEKTPSESEIESIESKINSINTQISLLNNEKSRLKRKEEKFNLGEKDIQFKISKLCSDIGLLVDA